MTLRFDRGWRIKKAHFYRGEILYQFECTRDAMFCATVGKQQKVHTYRGEILYQFGCVLDATFLRCVWRKPKVTPLAPTW